MNIQKTLGIWKNPNPGAACPEHVVHMVDELRCDGTVLHYGANIFEAFKEHKQRNAPIHIQNPQLFARIIAQNQLTDLSRLGIVMSKTTQTQLHEALRTHSIDPTTIILDKTQIIK